MGSPEKPLDVEMGDMSEEAKLNPSDVEVKTEQGLLKDEVKEPRFTGLKKEELLAISNQPKWVRARWALFIVFWIVWIAMLVGAILIVVNAPRCKPEPKPEWYQDTVAYAAEVKDFAEDFDGMKSHLPYVESLSAKTLLVSGAAQQNDPLAVHGNEEKFKALVDEAHEKGMKVMLDMVVDSLPTDNAEFVKSSQPKCTGKTTNECGMFVWMASSENDSDEWSLSPTRNESYRVNDKGHAIVNYGGSGAMPYVMSILDSWFARDIDGVQIRDVSKIQGISSSAFVSQVWGQYFTKNESHPTRALYVYSSAPDANITPEPTGANQTNTIHSPVFFNSEVAMQVGVMSGKKIQNAVMQWRNQSRNIGGFVVSPLGGPLAASRPSSSKLAAGLNLLSMALPGVPMLRSGDELAATTGPLSWDSQPARDSVPVNGSSKVLKQTKELTIRRVDGIQGMPSLRFDTRDADTFFDFLDTGNDDIVAFRRKWDQKAAVLVVGNMSPNNHTVNVAVKNGLMDEKELAKKATVLISSDSSNVDGSVDLEKLNMMSGTTLILK